MIFEYSISQARLLVPLWTIHYLKNIYEQEYKNDQVLELKKNTCLFNKYELYLYRY